MECTSVSVIPTTCTLTHLLTKSLIARPATLPEPENMERRATKQRRKWAETPIAVLQRAKIGEKYSMMMSNNDKVETERQRKTEKRKMSQIEADMTKNKGRHGTDPWPTP